MRQTAVYVAGNGNKIRKELLKAEWDAALLGDDVGAASRMACCASLRRAMSLLDLDFDQAGPGTGAGGLGDSAVRGRLNLGLASTRWDDKPAFAPRAGWRDCAAEHHDLVALDGITRLEYELAERCPNFLIVNGSPNRHGIRDCVSRPPVRHVAALSPWGRCTYGDAR